MPWRLVVFFKSMTSAIVYLTFSNKNALAVGLSVFHLTPTVMGSGLPLDLADGWVFICSLICSFNKKFLSVNCVPGSVSGAYSTEVVKIFSPLRSLQNPQVSGWERSENRLLRHCGEGNVMVALPRAWNRVSWAVPESRQIFLVRWCIHWV